MATTPADAENVITIDGRTTWNYPIWNRCMFPAGLALGIFFFAAGIVMFVLSIVMWADITPRRQQWISLSVFGFLLAAISFRMIGRNVVVFDNDSQTISIENAGWCFLQKKTSEMGPYGEFKECALKFSQGDATIQFLFNDGPKVLELNMCGAGSCNFVKFSSSKQQKRAFVDGLNAWWKTTPFYQEIAVAQQGYQAAELEGIAVAPANQ